ncbi:MAG: ABC transporter permease [Bacilli bacterium]|nr:ABC transporter permease [Bacilli bacterium]
MEKAKKTPLLHISRRMDVPRWEKIVIRVATFVGAFVLCALICSLFKWGTFFNFFQDLFGSLVSKSASKPLRSLINTLEEMALLLGISLALLPAFKMKFWNLGAEGQVLMGGFMAAMLSKFLPNSMPTALATVIMLVAAVAGGAVWSLLPAVFKAYFNTNETLFTLMMNYVAMGVITCFIRVWNPEHGTLDSLSTGMLPQIGGYSYVINIIVVTVLVFAMYGYLKYTKHGFELSVVGASRNTAIYAGINTWSVIIRTAVLSGALCGLVGWLIVAGADQSVSSGSAGGRGFTGVLIAWLGNFNPFYMALIAFFVAFVTRGSSSFATEFLGGNSSFPKITIALFFFAVLVGEFFLNYKVHINRKEKKQALAGKEAK